MSIMSQEAKRQNNCVLHWTGDVASANSPKQITSYGDVKQILPFPSAGIGMFDGNGSYLTVSESDDWNLWSSTSNSTVEFKMRFNSRPDSQRIVGQYTSENNRWVIYISGSGYLGVTLLTGGATTFNYVTAFIPVVGTWYDVAIVKSGSTCYMFVDGQSKTVTINTAWGGNYNMAEPLNIGYGSTCYDGQLSELRISSVARYTANFTPPRRQLESDEHTKLLIHFNRNDTTFIDSSPSAHSITAYGNATQLCSPCGSGVAYFDGTGDYIAIDNALYFSDLSSSNFTLEFNIKFNEIKTIDGIVAIGDNTSGTGHCGIKINLSTNRTLAFLCSSGSSWILNQFTTTTVVVNQMYHIAIVRNGTIFKAYIDGVEVVSGISSKSILTTAYNRIGRSYYCIANNLTIYDLNGYISEFRISNIARYIANFVPPTQPFKPDPYTKLLLHMDGVGNAFYDSSDPPGDNGFPILPDGVTVTPNGTFAVQKMKDGRNIWKFDGSTNYITISDHASWSMFLNDFTIAGWVKFDSVAANKVIIGQYTDANNQWYLQWTTGNIIQLYGITSSTARFDFSCPLAAVANIWYHIVVQRSGSSCIMYINGVAQTVTQTTAFSATATDIAAVLSIGKINTGYQTGNIKDLQIFTKALTMDQISALYQETFIY